MTAQRKVYDSDVQTCPSLRHIAEQYAREYIGDFHMMIHHKQMLLMGGSLSPASIRAVLNVLRYDTGRADLQAAVSAVLRHPSTPPPEDMAQVIQFDQAQRRIDLRNRQEASESRRARMRESILHLRQDQFTVKARFATTHWKAAKPVLHWLRPDEHEASWRLHWMNGPDENYERICARGAGYEREFHLTVRAWCRHIHQNPHLWTHRPTIGEAWEGYRGDDTPIPDCKGCLRNIAMTFMDEYPPDRHILTGEYLT